MQPRHYHELQCIHKDTWEKADKRITEAETPFEGQQWFMETTNLEEWELKTSNLWPKAFVKI